MESNTYLETPLLWQIEDLMNEIDYGLPKWLKIAKEVIAETPLKSRL